MKKFWKIFSPYFHIITFVLVIVFAAALNTISVSAHETRISALELQDITSRTALVRLEQKLDDVIDFFHVPRKHGEPNGG